METCVLTKSDKVVVHSKPGSAGSSVWKEFQKKQGFMWTGLH